MNLRTKLNVTLSFVCAALASCAGSGPRMLATGQSAAQHLTVDLTHVYWTTTDGRTSTLLKALKEESDPPVQVVSFPGSVQAITVDDDGLYLVVSAGGDQGQDIIRKVPKKQGQKPSNLAVSRNKITSIALDATHVYWTQTGTVGDADETLSPGVLRAMRTGGTPLNLSTRQPGTPCQVTLSATHVYWVNSEPGKHNTVLGQRKAGGEVVSLAVVPESDTAGVPALAADDLGVYLKTRTAVVRLAAEGGPPVKLASVPDSDASQLAIDARYLYFSGPRGPMRVSLQGGTASALADGVAKAIAVDSQAVYWLSATNVMLVPKR